MADKKLGEIRRTESYQRLDANQRAAVDELYRHASPLDANAQSLSDHDLDVLEQQAGHAVAAVPLTATRQQVLTALRQEILPGAILDTRAPAGVSNPVLAMVRATYPLRGLYDEDNYQGQVMLTFDDGPHPANTGAVLDELLQHGIAATFFVTGKNVNRSPAHRDLIRRIVDEGHELGHHGWDHTDFRTLSKSELLSQLTMTQEAVDQVLGYHYVLDAVRPPYAGLNENAVDVLSETGLNLILWDLDSGDWRFSAGPQVADRVLRSERSLYSQNGGVVLMHDTKSNTGVAVNAIVEDLSSHADASGQPFEFKTVGQALEAKYSSSEQETPTVAGTS